MKLLRIFLFSLYIVLILLCGEIIIRVFYPQHYANFFPYSSEYWRAGDADWLKYIRFAKKIGFEIIPSAGYFSNLGFFDKDRKIEKNKGTFRILVLGDSVTTHGSPPYPALLEELLNTNPHKYDFEVWNCAFPTYNTMLGKIFYN